MKLPIVLLFLLSAWLCQAQQVVNATGNTLSGAGLTVDYSVGEIAITTLSTNQEVVTQGLLQPNTIFAPTGWNPVPCMTGIVHTVAVLDTATTNIAGLPLAPGDLVGFFYQDVNGTLKCSDFGVWKGMTLTLDLCGDNPATPDVKEGYAIGENFLVKVWKDGMEYSVTACYLPPNTLSLNNPNATGSFVAFGLSYIECLKTPPAPSSHLDCSTPIPIACGDVKTGNNANGVSSANAYNCFDNLVDGPEVVYEFVNPVAQNVLITLTGLQSDLELLLLKPCDHNSCLNYSDRTGNSPEAIFAENLPAGTYNIVIEGYLGASSSYHLAVNCGNNISNGPLNCANATAISCGQTVNGNTNTGADQVIQYGCSTSYESGKEVVYTFTSSVNKVVSVSIDGLTADLDLFVLDQCDPKACVGSSTLEDTKSENVLFNATAGKTYYIVVDGYFDQESAFSLNVKCYDPCPGCPVPDYQVDCSMATPIQCGVPVTGNTNLGIAHADQYGCAGHAKGKELVYKFENAITQDITIILSGLSTDLNLFLLSDCNVFNCIGVGNKSGTSDEGIIKQALPPGIFYIVVDGFDNSSNGSFQLMVNCSNPSLNCQSIDLVKGTNFISSNIMPIDPSIDAIFPPSAQSPIIAIENQNNQSYSPNAQSNPNSFSPWDFRKGYRIKALQPVTVQICGTKADPNTPIPYFAATQQGFQINNWVAYLKDDPAMVADKFSPASTPKIYRVWNMPTGPAGNLLPQSYLVTLQSGTNFEMRKGRGYIVNASADGDFKYGLKSNVADDRGPGQLPLVVENGCRFFTTPFQSTLRSATVIIPQNVLQSHLSQGDEIGIFGPNGVLYGSGRFDGYGLAMVATGDDPGTTNHLEGFAEGASMQFRLWKAAEAAVYNVNMTFESGNGQFVNENVFIVSGMTVQQASSVQTAIPDVEWSAFPNPATDDLHINLLLPDDSDVNLQLLTIDGKLAATIFSGAVAHGHSEIQTSVHNLPAGIYLARLTTVQGVWIKKITISK